MVEKGLKPGGTFVDGGRAYKVLSVYPNGNYVSKEIPIGELAKEETVVKKVTPAKPKTTRKTGGR